MRFKPLTTEELEQFGLLEEGQYSFEVVEASDTTTGPNSKVPGTEMIKLKLRIYDALDKPRFVYCNLVESYALLLAHFCKITHLTDKYKLGHLSGKDCVGKKGFVVIAIKPAAGQYKASNEVKDFIEKDVMQLNLVPTPVFEDDKLQDIPF